MNIQNLTILGAGRIGSQAAFQAAFHGYRVVLFDINEHAVAAAKERVHDLAARYIRDLEVSEYEIAKAFGNLSYTVTMSQAASNADLIIEAIPSDAGVKSGFYRQLSRLAPDKTIFVAASATRPFSGLENESGRPDRFIAIQFAGELWKNKKVGLTVYKDTDVKAFYRVIAFVEDIGLTVLPIHVPE